MSDHEKMLERVRALLAKAASTEHEAEAETFRAKADELMTKYAIEMWQVEHAQQASTARPVPVARQVDFQWYWKMDNELGGGLWSLFLGVAAHCRCAVAHKYAHNTIPVIGLPADLDYMDLLFTHLFAQLVSEMDPSPRPGEPLIEALVRMKEAGIKWEEIFNRLKRAGHYDPDTLWSPSKMNYAGRYRQYCVDHGRPQLKVMPTVYRRSFVSGYVVKVKTRLRNQREQQGQNTGSMALALRDISQLVRDTMMAEFPDQAKKSRSLATSERKIDLNSVERGSAAGARAQIVTSASSRVTNESRKGIES